MKPNTQPISKVVKHDGAELLVHSIFYTIQGEGPFCGYPAVFIRLAGCNLQCPWCDTEYTESASLMPIEHIVEEAFAASGFHCRFIVITGGEPFRQPIGPLLEHLVDSGFFVQVETNGTLPPPSLPKLYGYDLAERYGVYVVCSPKTGVVNPAVAAVACCYKYVADVDGGLRPEDGLPMTALGHVANPYLARPPAGFKGPIYLQPADHKDPEANRKNIELVVQSAMEHGYVVQLQIHKYLNVE